MVRSTLKIPADLVIFVSRGLRQILSVDDLPIALPTAHATKLVATTVAFLVCPAMFREIMESDNVCADQKDNVM